MVVNKRRVVERSFPRFIGWTSKHLYEIESKKVFGIGYVDGEEYEKMKLTAKVPMNAKSSGEPIEQMHIGDDTRVEESPQVIEQMHTGEEDDRRENTSRDKSPQTQATTDVDLFHDYIKCIERAASALAEFEDMSHHIVKKLPKHAVLRSLVSRSRLSFSMPPIGEKDNIGEENEDEENEDGGEPKLGEDEDCSKEKEVDVGKGEDVVIVSQDSFWDQPEQLKILHDIWDQLDRVAEMHIQPTRQDVDLTPPSFSLKLSQEWRAHFVDLGVIKETNDVEQGARVNDEASVDLQSPQKIPDPKDANNQTDVEQGAGVDIGQRGDVLPEVVEPNKPTD